MIEDIDFKNNIVILKKESAKDFVNHLDSRGFKQIIKKRKLPKIHLEKIDRTTNNEFVEYKFKMQNIRKKRIKWYNPLSWFNRSIILEDCEFVDEF